MSSLESLELEGYEQVVVDYVKKVAADRNGKVALDIVDCPLKIRIPHASSSSRQL